MRAGIYMRVSTEDQKHGHSFETQERECREYAEQQGWEVAEVYDDTRSGSLRIEARPGAMRLLADATHQRASRDQGALLLRAVVVGNELVPVIGAIIVIAAVVIGSWILRPIIFGEHEPDLRSA